MKKGICLLFTVIVIITSIPISAFAASGDRESCFDDITCLSNDTLTDEEYQAVVSIISSIAQQNITQELIDEARAFLEERIENSRQIQVRSGVATVDSVMLETSLCQHDGLSLVEIGKIGGVHANAARDEAVQLYTDLGQNIEMKRDAFRHMTWNFRSAKDVGAAKTKIAVVNHEWARLILDSVNQYMSDRYDYYFNLYYWQIVLGFMSVDSIYYQALTEGYAYAVTYRDALASSCRSSLAFFNATFSLPEYIMDFWNNRVGRQYASSNPNNTTDSVFTIAWNAGQLIKHEGNTEVTTSRRAVLQASDWWYN